MNFPMKIAAVGMTLSVLVACGQQEEAVVVVAETPIFAKDGTIIGMRPAVSPGGGSGSVSAGSFSGDDSDNDNDG